MKNFLNFLFISTLIIVLFSCEKGNDSNEEFLGVWEILSPENDTIRFNDDSFSRKYNDGINHSFEYSSNNDSITIQYKGPNKILVQPSTHFYEFKNNELLIDFSNGCYGFDRRIYELIRVE